jgi:hypothetical protein
MKYCHCIKTNFFIGKGASLLLFLLTAICISGLAQSSNPSGTTNEGEQGGLSEMSKYWGSALPFDLKISLDWAKTIEKGASSLTYDPKNRANILIYMPLNVGNPFANPNSSSPGELSADEDRFTGEFQDHYVHKKTITGEFMVGVGLEYVGKGASFKTSTGKAAIKLNYIEIPIHLSYYSIVGPGLLYGGLGPYFAYGIGGRTFDESSFGENAGGYKRFDAGLSLMAGYRLKMGAIVELGYDLGLANITYPITDVKSHNRSFSINVGYNIGRLLPKKK